MTVSASSAKRYALQLLSYRDRSEKELKERLGRKGFSEKEVSDTLEFLMRSGYLNDRSLAENLKRQALEKRMLGYQGTRMYLEKRGLSQETIESVLEYDEEAEGETLRRLLDKRVGDMGNYLTPGGKRRLWNYLARRGYSYGMIRKALGNFEIKEEES